MANTEQKRKKFFWAAVLAGISSVALGIIFFSTTGTGRNIVAEGSALAVRSWNEVFQNGTGGDAATEIDFGGGDASSSASFSGSTTGFDDAGDNSIAPVVENAPAKRSSSSLAPVSVSGETSSTGVTLPENNFGDGTSSDTDANGGAASSVPENNSAPPQTCNVADASSANGASPVPSHEIILNEIAWMGSPAAPGETASHASDREWIELKNSSANDENISGWQLLDAFGNLKITFGAADTIPAGSFYLLARASSTFFNVPVDKLYSGSLPNAGDTLVLFDAQCAPSDVLDASAGWPAGSNVTKQTLERNADGGAWHTSVSPGGTPRAENSSPTPVIETLSVATEGASGGVVSSVPAGIDCGSECSADYASGTVITLTESPGPDATFNGWSGACSGMGACSFGMAGAMSVTADFNPTALSPASETIELAPGIASSSPVPSSSPPVSSPPGSSGHPVIAAVQIGGASSSNDFVKITNPAAAAVDMSGWKLHKRSSSGTDYSLRTFPEGSTVAPGGTFVWANSEDGFSGSIGANVSSTETLAADNSVALFDASGTLVDEVAWGTGTDQYVEGSAYPTDPAPGQVLVRNVVAGVPIDTDDNAADFTLQ